MKEEALISGFSSPFAAIYIKTSDTAIEFSSDTGFGSLLTKELLTDNGKTVGERNRIQLHEILDAWFDKTWEKNT